MSANISWTRYWTSLDKPIQNYDFLPDPETLWGDKEIVPFEKIQHIPCLILVGNPGIGKSSSIEYINERLTSQNIPSLLVNFGEFTNFNDFKSNLQENETFRTWQDNQDYLHLFLDSLDEGRLVMQRLEHDLRRFLSSIPSERLLLRITCRAAELPSDFSDLLKPIWSNIKRIRSEDTVKVYQLAQLREYDAWQFAEQYATESGLDTENATAFATRFIKEVNQIGVASFAAYPITLDMLLKIYKANGTLPTERKEIYAQGCRFLAQENSKTRIDDGFVGKFEVDERLKAARQLAALTTLGNFTSIDSRAEHLDQTALLGLDECYLPEQNWSQPKTLLEETLQTHLFRTLSYRNHTWAHLSYSEFLAADFLSNKEILLKQIQNLFINPTDPTKKIAPKLQETAAWLASMRSDVFAWIFRSEPIILIKSNSIQLTLEQRFTLINQFIERYAAQVIIEDRLEWNDYKRLNHPHLGEQLRPYLQDKVLPFRARNLCMDLAVICDVAMIDDVLIALALDREENIDLRKGALSVLQHSNRRIIDLQALRPLVLQSNEYNIDEDILARSLDILWPQYLTAMELFERLRIPHIDNLQIGSSYDNLLRGEIVEQLDKAGLIIALDWVIQQGGQRDHDLSLSGLNFVMEIMRRAWNFLHNEPIRLSFARAAWTRLSEFNPVIEGDYRYWVHQEPQYDYTQELRQDTQKRHTLLQSMLDVLSPENISNESLLIHLLFPLGSRDLPFAIEEDIPWLIEQSSKDVSEGRRSAYSYLVYLLATRLIPYTNQTQWAYIYDECESGRNPSLLTYFQDQFNAWELTSEKVLAARRIVAQQLEWMERRQEHELKKVPVNKHLRDWLTACEEDSSKWWGLSQSLVSNEYGHFSWGEWDLRKGYGWQTIQDDTETLGKVVKAAFRYIKEQHPYIGNYEPLVPLMDRPYALEGYRALVLLARLPLFDDLSPDDWQRWASVVVFNTIHKGQEIDALDDKLLQNAWLYGTQVVFDYLRQTLGSDNQHDKSAYHIESVLYRFKLASSNELAQVLLSYLKGMSPEDERFFTLLHFILQLDEQIASQSAEQIAINYLSEVPDTEPKRKSFIRIISTLSHYARNNDWWEIVWKALSSDIAIAREVLGTIADLHSNPYLRYLTDFQLGDLFYLATEVYPYADDIDFHSGAVPKHYTEQEWREGILRELAGRGTTESIAILTKVFDKLPDHPNLGYLIAQAKARFHLESWVALPPNIILKIAINSKNRFVRSSDQLFELVIETLHDIQTAYNASAPMKNSVWHRQGNKDIFRPASEEGFSDALAEWLRVRLRSTTVNREPQVRFISQTHERTDIQIETFSDTEEPLIVIIEVKGCWYTDIFNRIQSQLVNEYLAKHDRCKHGLYLVGYFSSDRWDTTDGRRRKCGKHEKEILKQKLEAKAKAVITKKPVVVETLVFEASI